MYCIYNKARKLYCRWNEKVIVFDTTDQAYEFMNLVPAFFAENIIMSVLFQLIQKWMKI